ncbi:hypothetical protein IscW_ISCW018007, partial [Ixodes scapularis]
KDSRDLPAPKSFPGSSRAAHARKQQARRPALPGTKAGLKTIVHTPARERNKKKPRKKEVSTQKAQNDPHSKKIRKKKKKR